MGYQVENVCGGDFNGEASSPSPDYGAQSFYGQWFRKVRLIAPLVNSISERRDMKHDAAIARHLDGFCREFKPTVIWERLSRLHCAGLTVARRIGAPYVLEWKDNLTLYGSSLFRARANRMEKMLVHEADAIVVESEVLRQGLIAAGIAGDKILVALNAADPEQFQPDAYGRKTLRDSLGLSETDVLVGYLGSYAWYHDSACLVKAMIHVGSRGFQNIKCLMVGAGKDCDHARRIAQESGFLGTHIVMRPGVSSDQVAGILRGLDIAVLPGSTDIICPIKIQEYMASGLATLAPDYACNREVICHGENGMLFKPKDAGALAEKIILLARDAATRARLGEAAKQEVRRRMTWEKTWGEALSVVMEKCL